MDSTLPYSLPRETLHSSFNPPLHFKRLPSQRPSGPWEAARLLRWGGGRTQGAPEPGVPGTEATHVSRRIFLSATTSPVNLFLALYATPYVSSLIFSTFWKFSMKR